MRTFVLTLCIALLSVTTAQASLLGHWAFNEGSGSTTVNLANPGVGNAVIGESDGAGGITPLDTLWQNNDSRGCIYLTETNFEFANVSADFTNITTDAVTIATWIKRQGGNMAAEPTFGKGPTTYGMTLYDSSGGGPGFAYVYVESANQGTAAGAVPGYEWTHVAMTFDGSVSGEDNLFVYINGAVAGSKEITNSIPDTAGIDFRIGGNRTDAPSHEFWNSAYFNGLVDDVKLYDNALSGAEIAELAIPEPNSLVLLVMGGASLMLRIRRRRV